MGIAGIKMSDEYRIVSRRIQFAVGLIADTDVLDCFAAHRRVRRKCKRLLFGHQIGGKTMRSDEKRTGYEGQNESGGVDREVLTHTTSGVTINNNSNK